MTVGKTIIEAQVASHVITMSQPFPADGAALATQAVIATAGDVYAVVIDNSLNTSASYLKCYDTAGIPTIGGDNPAMILKSDAATKVQYSFDNGIAFAAGIAAAVLTSRGTNGTTAPSSEVNLTFLVTPT
jgi:hypothetical protein